MKKLIASLALVAVVLGPEAALATTGVTTSLTRGAAAGNAPQALVKWEMNDVYTELTGTDDSTNAGAQFSPTAAYGVDKKYSVCGIVMDADGVADIDSVYSDVWYPEEIYLGTNHPLDRQGCGQIQSTECRMTKLAKADGISLFCNKIKNLNNNLPTFADVTGNNYDYFCKADGELNKETAYVACCDRTLNYEDPSGIYKTLVFAQDKEQNNSNYLYNNFEYLPVTAFETDFNAVSYGDVRLNTEKIVNGDLTWDALNAGKPSVRNIGNTRAQLTITQDDMGLGMTGSDYNVAYKSRVGNVETDWTPWYAPYTTENYLRAELDLSELDEVDFGIKISKFPPLTGETFQGNMTLGARMVDHMCCENR